MYEALILIAHAIALAHDRWRATMGRRLPLSGRIAVLEERILRRPTAPEPDDRILPATNAGLLAKRPNHIWMIDFTRLKGIVRPVFVGAVIDAFSRKVLAVGFIRGEPNARFAVRLLRRAISRCGSPTWLVSDKDRAFRNKLVNGLLRRLGICRRYGAVGRKGSIAIIERMWRSMKQEYV